MMRESNTLVIERNQAWSGPFETEPTEVAWASEAIFFIRALEVWNVPFSSFAYIEISPDGIHWCTEGTVIDLPAEVDQVTFVRLTHFGGWLRIVGEVPEEGQLTVIVYLTLKA